MLYPTFESVNFFSARLFKSIIHGFPSRPTLIHVLALVTPVLRGTCLVYASLALFFRKRLQQLVRGSHCLCRHSSWT